MKRSSLHNRFLRRAAARIARARGVDSSTKGPTTSVLKRNTLAALTASAMALPGLAGSARAETGGSGRWSLEHSSSYYKEQDLDEDLVSVGSTTQRYEVQGHQFRLKAPFTQRTDFQVDLAYERMSGASPWFVSPGTDGEPVQVMSGASIEDQRLDVLGRANYELDNGSVALLGGVSNEKDYFAGNGGLEASFDWNENNTSLVTGLGVSIDTITPTDADEYATRPDEEHKQSYGAFVSVSQVLTRSTLLRLSANFQQSRGFLSDPYKLVSVAGVNLADSRPQRRNQLSGGVRLRQHVAPVRGTLHADYAYSRDDWGIQAHTMELAWHQSIWRGISLVPSARYYTQTGADFYDLYFLTPPSDGYASSDYRLSPFGAISWSVRAEADVPLEFRRFPFRIRTALGYERYHSSSGLSLKDVPVANPGLVSYQVVRLTFSVRF